MTKEILIVDDEKDIRLLIQGILEDEGFKTRQAASSKEALDAVTEKVPSLVVLDIWLEESDSDGIAVLKTIKEQHKHLPVLMISGHGTIETAVSAIKEGAYDFIEKPFQSDRLIVMIQRALETASLKKENEALKARIETSEDFIGSSSAITALKNQIQKIAPTNSRVFISGSQGTGKEIIAREIHKLSDRAEKAFVGVNCAALHPERLEEELFGSELEGVTREGFLEQANGGTLLLDEVADMPLETQGKILRVLQDNQIHRLGGQEPIDIDVRFLASTNRDIQALIEKGDFREDLYYRLNVVPLTIPDLKERTEDIEPLMNYFAENYATQNGQTPRGLSEDALKTLKLYQWPGNVRQLKNMAEWLMIMSSSTNSNQAISETELPPEFKQNQSKADEAEIDYSMLALRDAREAFEKEYLLKQMARFKGNVSKTAEFVGMERSALHRKLKALDISLTDKHDSNSEESKAIKRA